MRAGVAGGAYARLRQETPCKGGQKMVKAEPQENLSVKAEPLEESGVQPDFVVSSSSKDKDLQMETLTGDYVAKGENHGKPFYQKLQRIDGHEDVSVFLYWWDNRDGEEFSGWWFGDQVGGSNVWARNESNAEVPPMIGWRVPWDAPAKPGLMAVKPHRAPASGAQAVSSGPSAPKQIASTPSAAPQHTPRTGAVVPGRLSKLNGASEASSAQKGDPEAGKGHVRGAVSSSTALSLTSTAGKVSERGVAVARGETAASAWAARVENVRVQVDEALKSAENAASDAKALSTGTPNKEELLALQVSLGAQQDALQELHQQVEAEGAQARKGGQAARTSAVDLAKLSQRFRATQAMLKTAVAQIKTQLARAAAAQAQAERAAKEKAKEEEQKEFLASHTRECEELVSGIEESLSALVDMGEPLATDATAADADMMNMACSEVESAAKDIDDRIADAKKELQQKQQTVREKKSGLPEAGWQSFMGGIGKLQSRLGDVQRKLGPFRKFRQDFKARVEAKRSLAGLTDKLSEAELEAEKADMMTLQPEGTQMSEEDVEGVEKVLRATSEAQSSVSRDIDKKSLTARGPMQEELAKLKSRASALRSKTDAIRSTMAKQRAGVRLQRSLLDAADRVKRAEDCLTECGEAELPFLKGIEVLPFEECKEAIQKCEAAATKAEKQVAQVRSFLQNKLTEVTGMASDAPAKGKATEQLDGLLERLETCNEKVEEFKKETAERKPNAVFADVLKALDTSEQKMRDYVAVAQVFSDDLGTVSVETMQEAVGQVGELDKHLDDAIAETKRLISCKQTSMEMPGNLGSNFDKLQARLRAVQTQLNKHRKAVAQSERLIKGKAALTAEQQGLDKLEEEVAKVELQAEGGIEGNNGLGDALLVAQRALKARLSSLESQIATAAAVPSLRAALQKLMQERCKKCQDRLNIAAGPKDKREALLGNAYLRFCEVKADEVEALADQLQEMEHAIVNGKDASLPSNSAANFELSDKAAAALASAVAETWDLLASTSLEIKQHLPQKAAEISRKLGQVTARVNAANGKLGAFKKKTQSQKQLAQVQDATEMVEELETCVEELVALDKLRQAGLAETDEKCADSAEPINDVSEKLTAKLKETRDKMEVVQSFVKDRRTGAEACMSKPDMAAGSATVIASVKELQARLVDVSLALTLAEGQSLLAEAGEEVKKMRTTCAPLLEKEGEQLRTASSSQILSDCLRSFVKEKSLSTTQLFIESGSKGGRLGQDAFITYLDKIPEASFPLQQRVAIFKSMDKDGDGEITLNEFQDTFKQQMVCVSEVSLTDGKDVSASSSICKVEVGDLLQCVDLPCEDEAVGVQRVEVEAPNGKSGWVTIKSQQGTVFAQPISAYEIFCKQYDMIEKESTEKVQQATSQINSKVRAALGPNAGAKGKDSKDTSNMAKLKADLQALQSKAEMQIQGLSDLKKRVQAAKTSFVNKETADREAAEKAAEIRKAEALLIPAAIMNTVEAAVAALTGATEPLLLQSEAEAKDSFPGLAKLLPAEVDQLASTAFSTIAKAKKAILERRAQLDSKAGAKVSGIDVSRGVAFQAKHQLQKQLAQVEAKSKKCASSLQAVWQASQKVVDTHLTKVIAALRNERKTKNISAEAYFNQLVGAGTGDEATTEGEQRLSEDAFYQHVASLESLNSLLPDQARLICRHLEVGGLSRRRFLNLFKEYYVVSKATVITGEMDISQGQGIRKLEKDEIIEVLGDAIDDEKSGLSRLRGKAIQDGLEGWITVKGNQGTQYLKEGSKPFHVVTALQGLALETDAGESTLGWGEVLELLEGPRNLTKAAALRVRVKLLPDGETGWLSIKDKYGKSVTDEDAKIYVCKKTIAITTEFDIMKTDVVKKLSTDDLFVVEEGPQRDSARGIERVRGRPAFDTGKSGWITTKGDAGTVYAEPCSKHMSLLQGTVLQKAFASNSETSQQLKAGVLFKVLEGPKEETFKPDVRAKVRATSDGTIGWISTQGAKTKPWSPQFPLYKCTAAAPMHSQLEFEDAEILRQVAASETLLLLDGPVKHAGALRMRAKANKDGDIGWISIRDSDGKRYMVC
eukprot:TRINITY_DN32870_c0_g1_i1.p1 TRINITY_DN32870_c0_g1~~TRINITY_DN32870_c0_g1_i1.p1  ORF type:complete len:2068 (-),score=548.13 TRINITY_DN32870_c0_g1_i1:205-6408(-)